MPNPEMLDLGQFGIFAQAPAVDVPFVRQGGDVDPGAVRSTARIEANSLRVKAIAQENTQADMPDWMAGSIDAFHANIGCEHGFGLREYKTSPNFHESPVSSSQADLESLAQDSDRILLDHLGPRDFFNYYLYKYDKVFEMGESFDTNDQFTTAEEDKKGFMTDIHYVVHTNFVLTGSDDIEVMGHSGRHTLESTVNADDLYMFGTNALTFSYRGNSGNNTFDMVWGFFIIDLSVGGDNTISVKNSVARGIIGGGGDDTISITGTGAHADLIDLRNGGNNDIHAEGWADIIGGAGNDRIVSQPSFQNGNGIRADLSAGGDNTVILRGAQSSVTFGAGNDTITVTNEWNNNGHPGNWSVATIDLSLGGANRVEIKGNTHTSGPTQAHITLGRDNDTILAGDHTVVTILGANSMGNDTITLGGTAGHRGSLHTGLGHTTINWVSGNYLFEFGSGDLTLTTGGDLHYRFVFDGSERTGNDTLILNNGREGGVVHTGQGHTDVTLNAGKYDFHLGSGSVSMSVHGHVGFSTIYDADGNLIVGRVNGQSSLAQAVHTFSTGEGINLQYSLQLGGGVDKVQFFAGSGHYQVTSSWNGDIFQLDFFGAGGTDGATFEVFDFKWGSDQIVSVDGTVFTDLLFKDGHGVRLQYTGEENGQHTFDVVAARDFGAAYDAGHVWMTVYSNDLPDLNFL